MASNILPLFWNLASSSKDARLTASVDLISTLEGFQQAHVQARAAESDSDDDEDEDEEADDDDDESGVEVDGSEDEGAVGLAYGNSIRKLDASLAQDNAEDVAYTVKRLVRGLASSRESSRFGFSVALTELLQRCPSVTPAQVLSLVMRNSHTSKAMKGSEERDALFARLFGITAIVESNALWRAPLNDFEEVIDALVVLGDKKNWIRESAWWGILQAAQGLTQSQVEWREEAVQKLTSLLKKGWTQEKLALALLLEKAQPNLDWKEIAYPAIRHTPILSSQNLPTLARILRDSQAAEDDDAPSTSQGSWKPQLHFVWTQIFDALLEESGVAGQASFQDFFRTVVDESLLANTASPQKRFWGFQVFIASLPRVDADIMPQLFTPNFMRCWMNNLSSQDRYLHKAAQQTANIVQDVAKANPKVGFALLSRLIGKHGRADFDRATKTKTVERILGNLNEEGVKEYVGYLKGVVVKDNDSDSADTKSLGERRKWAIEQLSSLVRNAKVPKSDDWVSEVLDFLMLHSLFFVKSAKPSKSSLLSVSVPKPPLSTGSVNVCRERFFAAILDLTTASPSREGEKRREQGRNDEGQLWLRRALEVIAQLEKDAKAFEPVVEVDEEIVKMRKDAMGLLEKVSSNDKQSADIVKACEVLLSYAILQTYEERSDMLETLEDVTTAVKAMFATKTKKSSKGKKGEEQEEEDPEAIDLLVDTLIALLDKNSGGLRSLATMVLALSAPALTASTIEHLLAQLDATPGTVEGPEIDAEELEEDEDVSEADSDEEADEAEDDDDEEDAESDEESEEEEEDDEDIGDVDPAFRKRVEEALRAAGMDPEGNGDGDEAGEDDEEDESSDEETWDDEQMMKVDEHLAKVFRDRKEGNSKQKAKRMVTDNVHFKTRILDLFDTYIRKQSSNPLVLETVMPLLRLVRRSGDEAVLSTKTSGIIRSRFDKPKEVPTADVARATAILGEVHNFARRANTNELASAAASCSLFVARCIAQSDPASTAVSGAYAATVNDYMTRKGSLVRVPFMKDYIKRFPVQAWPMRSEVLGFLQQGKGYHPFRQLQMYELIAAFASHLSNVAQSAPKTEVEAFVCDVRVAVYDTIRRVASSGASDGESEKEKEGWKTAWLKDVARHALQIMRSSKSVLSSAGTGESGSAKMKEVWAADELDALLETVQEGKTAKMGGLIQLVKQLRAVLDSDNGAQKKGSKRKAQDTEVSAGKQENEDVDMNGEEEKKVKKGKKVKVAKEGKEGKEGKEKVKGKKNKA